MTYIRKHLLDDPDHHDLENFSADRLIKVNAAGDALKAALDFGRALKKSVHDATSKSEVDAVVDNR